MFVVLFSEETSSDFREGNKEIYSFGVYTSCFSFSFCHCKRQEGHSPGTGKYINTYRVPAYLCEISVFTTGENSKFSAVNI